MSFSGMKVSVHFTVLCILAVGVSAYAVPEIRWQPVSASGDYHISDNFGTLGVPSEITLLSGGDGTVELHLYVSGWGTAPGTPELGAYQGTVESSGYWGSNAEPPDAGVDLTPLGWPETPGDGAFIDAIRPDFVMKDLQAWSAVSSITLDYEWVSVSGTYPDGAVDGVAAPYAGTLILEIPENAGSTYSIGFSETGTLFNAGTGEPIPGLVRTPVLITFPPIPAVSEWGLLILALLGLTAGTILFRGRASRVTAVLRQG